jgi:predicted RecB family nuclease
MPPQPHLKTCENGHTFYKSSDCPVCPVCEAARKPKDHFLSQIAAPARRALENHGITSLQELAVFSEQEVLGWHGMGKSTLPKLHKLLAEAGLTFNNKKSN